MPSSAGGQRIYGVVMAIVTDNNDPNAWGRVKLRFPWLDDDVETDWARVVAFGAGPASGAVFVPEVNDEVLVAFEHGDPRFPYVLGGLYNGVDKPKLGVGLIDGGHVKRRGIVSRKGHLLVFFDDDKKTGAVLLSSDGQLAVSLNQTNHEVHIRSGGTLHIECGGTLTIETGGDLEVKAGGQLSLKGSRGVKIQSDSVVDVDGRSITLN